MAAHHVDQMWECVQRTKEWKMLNLCGATSSDRDSVMECLPWIDYQLVVYLLLSTARY